MKKVMVFGTFDGVHSGHRAFFRQAADHGDWLMAVVARDVTVEGVKGKTPKRCEVERAAGLLEIDIIDDVLMGYDDMDKCAIVRDHKPHVVVLGYDQEHFIDDLESFAADNSTHDFVIIRANPYKEDVYKSSLLNEQ